VAQLAAALPIEYATLVRVLAYTGLRWGEATALQVKSYDAMRGRISVTRAAKEPHGEVIYGPTKTHAARQVVLPQHLRAEVSALQEGKGPDDLLFTTKDGSVLRHSNFDRRVFRPAVKVAGLAPLTKHDLRHTAASLAVASGANVKVVQRMLGHKTATLTLDLYAGLFENDLDDLANRLADAAMEAATGSNLQSISSVPDARVS
jgi:integrase